MVNTIHSALLSAAGLNGNNTRKAAMPTKRSSLLSSPTALFSATDSVQFSSTANKSVARHIPKKAYPFGTAGYRPGRAIEESEVNAITNSVADYVLSTHDAASGKRPLVVVGRDTRESSEAYIGLTNDILTQRGIDVLTVDGAVSTPLASYLSRYSSTFDKEGRKAALTVLLTASHNAYQEGGIKLFGPNSVNASKDVTNAIEGFLTKPMDGHDKPVDAGQKQVVDVNEAYFKALSALVSPEKLKDLKLGVDVHYGTGTPFVDYLKTNGLNLLALRNEAPPKGYNSNSEPTKDNLKELSERVVAEGLDIGVALDGDGDRFAAVDENGKMISVTDQLALSMHYMGKHLGKDGLVGRTQATSHYLDALYNQMTGKPADSPVFESPVGFKWFGPLFDNHDKAPVMMAMESSGGANSGYGVSKEKDGMLLDMLTLAAAAEAKTEGKTISQWVQHLRDSVPTKFDFAEYSVKDVDKKAVIADLESFVTDGGTLGKGIEIDAAKTQAKRQKMMSDNHTDSSDGVKLYFTDGSWALIRPSGTENKLRVYVEGTSQDSPAAAVEKREAIWDGIKTLLTDKFKVDPANMYNKSAK